MWDAIVNNRQWIFDGVGALVIIAFLGWLFRTRKDPKQQSQRSGSKSTNYQAGRDISAGEHPPNHDQ